MGKLKIAVYAICKNEEKFVKRWLDSVQEADYICVLDTGSTDKTIDLLKKHPKVILKQRIVSPWRFDVARNESMKLIPTDTDFCACVDLDEQFKKGWREKLENAVTDTTGIVQYRYTWNFNKDGSEGVVFFANKIHKYGDFFWKHPVHEVITPKTNKNFDTIIVQDIQLNHYADATKSRGQYLPLLELSVKEDPDDDRNVHYLAREYYFYGEYKKAIKYFKKHLLMPSAKWREERASSMRYIAKCYEALNKPNFVAKYYKQAILECPTTREAYYELGMHYFKHQQWQKSVLALLAMDNIKNRELNYMSSPDCWGYLPYDMMSICFYYLKNKTDCIKYAIKALEKDPNNTRIQSNLKLFYEMN